MRYYLITYGCQMNFSDSERIAGVLEENGYEESSKINEADLIVVNMCSIRQSAVNRVFGLQPKFKKLRETNNKLQTVLTGCILKKDRKKFAEYFDDVLDIKNLANNYLEIQPKYSSFPTAFVPISNGCNNFCSYCVVPYTRGKEINRPVDEILCEVKNLVNPVRNSEGDKKIQNRDISNGVNREYKEIWLLGQNVNSYKNSKINFPQLLKMINNVIGNFWIRFTSPHPKDFSNELIEVMAQSQKISPYLNLPVQSGNDEILRKMKRNYTTQDYRNLVEKIRDKIPDIALSTDVIVGFPGETKTLFENTVKLFREIKFDMAYIAQYSPRSNTAAFEMKDNIPKEEKRKREKILTEILKKTALEKNKRFIGKTIEILPTKHKNGFLFGKSFHYKTVKFKGSKDLIGKFQRVKIIDALPWGLKG